MLAVMALAQAAITLMLIAIAFGRSMDRFDVVMPATIADRVLDVLVAVFTFPVITAAVLVLPMAARGFPVEHLLLLANGMVWAYGGYGMWRWVQRRRLDRGP